jgi:hypothetical protein
MLLLRLSGVFLLRLAERKFLGVLFHEPPRNTRLAPLIITLYIMYKDWGRIASIFFAIADYRHEG